MIATDTISLNTKGLCDVLDITDKVTKIVEQSGIQNRLVNVFCSTGSITRHVSTQLFFSPFSTPSIFIIVL